MPITISGSTGIAGVDGSASTPAVQGTDTNTGIAFPAADTVAIGTGGTEVMRIDSSGNVGIGTSSPTEKLDVTGNSRAAIATSSDVYFKAQNSAGSLFFLQKSASAVIYTPTSQPLIFDIAGERMRIDASGNVGIGTSSPGSLLTVNGNLAFNSGYGSAAVAYGCRAWVNFNGTGTVAIRASGNVTSITDNGTGEYTLNFTTALPDANYSVVGSCGTGAAGNDDFNLTTNFNAAPTTTAARVGSQRANSGIATDAAYISVAIFR